MKCRNKNCPSWFSVDNGCTAFLRNLHKCKDFVGSEPVAEVCENDRILYALYSGVYDNLTCKEFRKLFPDYTPIKIKEG